MSQEEAAACFIVVFAIICLIFSLKPPKQKKPSKHYTLLRPHLHIRTKRCLHCNKYLHEHSYLDDAFHRNYYCSIKPKK